MRVAMSDNELSDPQRIKALEADMGKMRRDLARVTTMLRHTPRSTRLLKQREAIERVILQAQVEIAKIRQRAR